jgi:hypothetical protein
MAKRDRQTRDELVGMKPSQYKNTDTPGTYVVSKGSVEYTVSGLHSAEAVAGTDGTIKKA